MSLASKPFKTIPMLVFIGVVLPLQAFAQDFSAERFAGIVDEGMTMWHVPGIAVAVINAGEVVFQQGFGVTAADGGSAVDEHTLFANASTTKAMVVSGLLMLVDEGKLSLDDLVIDHIPELHFADAALTQQLTLRDLLAHRTGLPSTDFWTFAELLPLDEQIERLRLVEPVAAPRTRLIYQNTMFEIAGLIIERISGQSWDAFLAERLWDSIGMHETFGKRGDITSNLTHVLPHNYLNGEIRQIAWDLPVDRADAAGSAWTSIYDMSKWAQFLLRGGVTEDGVRLISEDGMHNMFEPQQLAAPDDFYPTVALTKPHWRTYGLGWFQQDFQGRAIDFHTGSLAGLIAIIGLDREADKAVIVLANRDHAEMRHALLWEVMDTTADAGKRDWNQEIFALYEARAETTREEWREKEQARLTGTRLRLPLDRYAGTYRSVINGDVDITMADGKLSLELAMGKFKMSHWHQDTFLLKDDDWEFGTLAVFDFSEDGSILSFGFFGDEFFRVDEAGN